jgi:hypothetical protein
MINTQKAIDNIPLKKIPIACQDEVLMNAGSYGARGHGQRT